MRILILLITLLPLYAKATTAQITVSSSPIANIIFLLDPKATVTTLAPTGTCPHEYLLKPSDFQRARNSGVIIYTSDDFEPFIKPFIKNSHSKVLNLSNLLNIQQNHNMHIWMSLHNVRKATHIIAQTLKIPEKKALQQIDTLMKYKKTQLSSLKSVLLLSDSLEYLFEDMPHIKVQKLYLKPGMTSAKDIIVLRNQKPEQCIIIDNHENVESISLKISHKVIDVDSEDWSIDSYKRLIDDIRDGCISR
jgi:zinc transport system substrate-binding protein